MPVREKVIKTLESILDADIYDNWLSKEDRQNVCDAIDLLKGKEAILPIQDSDYIWICGNCGEEIYNDGELHDNYCSNCGTKVKWDI